MRRWRSLLLVSLLLVAGPGASLLSARVTRPRISSQPLAPARTGLATYDGLAHYLATSLIAGPAATGFALHQSPDTVLDRWLRRTESAPVTCGTALSLAWDRLPPRLIDRARGPVPTAMAPLWQRPFLPGTRTLSVDGGRARIHYSVDSASPHRVPIRDQDRDGVPDQVQRLAQAVPRAHALLDRLGWAPSGPDPAAGGTPAVDIYLLDLASGVFGYAAIQEPARRPGRRGGFLVLDRRLLGTEEELAGLVAHQLTHLRTAAHRTAVDPWLHEATAVWVEHQLAGFTRALATRMHFPLRHGALSPFGETISFAEGNLLLPLFWQQHSPTSLLHAFWAAAEAAPAAGTLSLLEPLLREHLGTSLEDSLREYHLWLLLELLNDRRSPRRAHFVDHWVTEVPFRTNAAPLPQGGGMVMVAVDLEDRSPAGIELFFDGLDETAWGLDLVFQDRHSRDWGVAPVEVHQRRALLKFPASGVRAGYLVIHNLGRQADRGGDFNLFFDPLEGYPYRLAYARARRGSAGVQVEWRTLEETDVEGWMLFRSQDPARGFAPVDQVPVPAVGGTGLPGQYVYVDLSAPDPAYYRLEGITRAGFLAASGLLTSRP